ncbi:MAG: corrinoid protein [Lachnospiraceae bacterium]|nr:corrinoid protein [Lachnospiraceae bacterium]
MTFEELCAKAKQSLIDMDEDSANEVMSAAIEQGEDLPALLAKGYGAGMDELGDMFSCGEIFIPELLVSAEIMQGVSNRMDEVLSGKEDSENTSGKAKIVFATVLGDVHDIGKGICCSLLKANGFDVYDMGRDVPPEEIVDKAVEVGADFIALSSLLTTTMKVQEDVISELKKRGIRDQFVVMVGGAPVTERWAQKIGADYYTEDANEIVQKANELSKMRRAC